MKNILKIFLIVVIISIVISLIILAKLNKNSNVIDLSNYPEDKVFYKNFLELLKESDSSYNANEENTTNRLLIKVYDTNYNPIKDSEIEFYDDEGYLIFEPKTDDEGKIAISGFERNKIYYFRQTEVSKGYVLDDTLYRLTLEDKTDDSRYITIINANRELTEEEKNDFLENIPKSELVQEDEIVATDMESEQYKNEKSALIYRHSKYAMTYKELEGLIMDVSVKVSSIEKNNENYSEVTLRIPKAFIKKFSVEEIDDNDNQITIMDTDKNEKNQFYDGERFLINTKAGQTLKTDKYKFNITFEYNKHTYKISKEVHLRIQNSFSYHEEEREEI